MHVRPACISKEGPRFERFATDSDLAECRRLHQKHGKTYYFASRRFPARFRDRVDALYGFVRVPDEWVDNPVHSCREEQLSALAQYRSQLLSGLKGERPSQPVLRVFCDLIKETGIPVSEALEFLDAMETDLTVMRYPTYAHLQKYMRGSAAAVGVMMCYLLEAPTDEETLAAAMALGEAMQLTNFLRDVREDAARGRIYLPLEDLDAYRVTEEEILEGIMSERFQRLMRFEIDRARTLYQAADARIVTLPPYARKAVKLARILYSRILNHIERERYNVFRTRVRTTRAEKVAVAMRVVVLG